MELCKIDPEYMLMITRGDKEEQLAEYCEKLIDRTTTALKIQGHLMSIEQKKSQEDLLNIAKEELASLNNDTPNSY